MVTVGEPFERAGKWYYNVGLGGGMQNESRGYSTPDAARREASKLRNAIVAQQQAVNEDVLGALGHPDGTLPWYAKAMDVMAMQVVSGGSKEARENLKALAFAVNARVKLQDDKELREEVAGLKRVIAEILAAEKHGSRVTVGSPGDAVGARSGQ